MAETILVVNAGSSSIKFQLFEIGKGDRLKRRFKGQIEKMRWVNRIGNILMSAAARTLYGAEVSDLMTCYKMYPAALVRGLKIKASGFDFEAEFTARLAQRGARFAEVPVGFRGRTFAEGKKIHPYDAVRVMRELLRCKVQGEPSA